MEPVIKEFHDMADAAEADAFLREAAHHFICTDTYLPEGFPAALCSKIVVRGRNRRIDYMHVPTGAGPGMIRALCKLAMAEKTEDTDINLAAFLQGFVAQLKDKVDLREVAENIAHKVSELFDAEGASILVFDERDQTLRFAAIFSKQSSVAAKLRELRIPLGQGVAGWVAAHKKPQLVRHTDVDPRFDASVDKKTTFQTRDLLAAPILLGDKLVGVLEVVNRRKQPFCELDIPTLCVLASVVAIFLEKAQLIAERKRHLTALGKAEIANSVLHNIGNVLTSMTVSCEDLQSQIAHSQLKKLQMTINLLNQHEAELGKFFETDPRGKMVPQFLTGLAKHLAMEQESVAQEVEKIADKTHLMKDIIETQQTIARGDSSDAQDIIQVIEEALVVVQDVFQTHEVAIVRDFHTDRPVRGTKTKMVHILINLLKNAVEAVKDLPQERRFVRIETLEAEKKSVLVKIADLGSGISDEVRTGLFHHGFTTKENGHGFGLSFCAKAMEEMDGSIEVHSEGSDKGATFTLKFPDIHQDDLVQK